MPPMPPMTYRTPPLGEWFPVRVTDAVDWDGVDANTFVEVELAGDGTWGDKVGGRVGEELNPGIALISSFVEDDYAFARSAPGAGGLLWELLPVASAGAGGSHTFGGYDAPPSDDTIATDGTETTILTVTLPDAGTYWVHVVACAYGKCSALGGAAGYVKAILYNATDSVYVQPAGAGGVGDYNWQVVAAVQVTGKAVDGTAVIRMPVTVTGETDVELHLKCSGGPTWTEAGYRGAGADGMTYGFYEKLP